MRLCSVIEGLRRAATNDHPWIATPAEAGALVAEVERLREEVAGLRDVHAMMGAVAHNDAHLAAMEDFAVTKERAAVVAWLRDVAETMNHNGDKCCGRVEDLADAVARGEHRREEKP